MASGDISSVLNEILCSLKKLQEEHSQLASTVDAISGKVNVLASVKQVNDNSSEGFQKNDEIKTNRVGLSSINSIPQAGERRGSSANAITATDGSARRGSASSKIILTSYPGQSGVDPIQLDWGKYDPAARGPIIVGRGSNTIRRRNGENSISLDTLWAFLVFLTCNSYWCSWWILLDLFRARCRKQKLRSRAQARFHKY